MLHDLVQQRILTICTSLGLQAKTEFSGKGWRADVFVSTQTQNYAFEIQLSPQTLKKTQERQAKYIRDGIIGCWLFEKEPAKQIKELENLPIFKIKQKDNDLFVSLKDRKTLPLDVFIHDFLFDKIKFCHTIKPLPYVEIHFLEMKCYKCGEINHIYYIAPFQSACNTIINHSESMWVSKKLSFHPDILKQIQTYTNSEQGKSIHLASIKERYSSTVQDSYMSFGCNNCDSLFGDFFVHEAIMDALYGYGIVDRYKFKVDFDLNLQQNIPHWCHPGESDFCE